MAYCLIGVSNPGFSFTDNYIPYTVDLMKYLNENREKVITYAELQSEAIQSKDTHTDSPVRMIVPYLRRLNYINPEMKKPVISRPNKAKEYLTEDSEKLIKICGILHDAYELGDDHKIAAAVEIFRDMLKLQLDYLLKNDFTCRVLAEYLLKYGSLDKYEFYAITTFELNSTTPGDSYTTASEWIDAYRSGNIDVKKYDITTKNKKTDNSYGYTMNFLCDVGLCNYSVGHYNLNRNVDVKSILESI